MSWLDDMKADALCLAAPGFVLGEGDEIHVKVRSSEGDRLSSVTFEPAFFAIDVAVWRPTGRELGESLPGQIIFRWMATGQKYYHAMYRCYLGNEARDFLVELMNLGSQGACDRSRRHAAVSDGLG